MIVRGRVVDERGMPIRDVMVYSGNDWSTTDADGYFTLTTMGEYIGAMKKGYSEFKDKIPPFDTANNILQITLVRE